MGNPKDRLIVRQQREIGALRRTVEKLKDDKIELKKFIVVILQDNLGGPGVISRESYAEANAEFDLDENPDGGLIIKIRRAAQ